MEIEKAEKAQAILNRIYGVKEQVKWLKNETRTLCFGNVTGSEIIAFKSENYTLREILDKHHRMIIDELEAKINNLYDQLNEL